MNMLTNIRFWMAGLVLAAVPAASMLRDHGLLTLSGWPQRVVDSYVFWRVQAIEMLADLTMMLAGALRGMAEDAVNLIVILLALYLATLLSGSKSAEDDGDSAAEKGEIGRKSSGD